MWLGRPSGSNPTSSLDNQTCHLLPASPYPSGPRHLQTSLALSLPLVLPGPPLSLSLLPSHTVLPAVPYPQPALAPLGPREPVLISLPLVFGSSRWSVSAGPPGSILQLEYITAPRGWAQGGTQGRWQALSLVSATTVRHTALASSQPHSRRSAAPWPCAPSGSVPVGPTWPQPGRRSR